MKSITRRRTNGSPIGWLLVGVGALLLLGSMVTGFASSFLWPLFFVLPGLALFTAVKQFGRGWAWLTVPATMFMAMGGIFLFTSVTGWWHTMAYLWPLIFPGSFGLGMAVAGDIAHNEGVGKAGEIFGKIGLGLSILGAIFFEILVNFSGLASGFTGIAIAAVVIIAGLFLLFRPKKSSTKAYRPNSTQNRQMEIKRLEREVLGHDPYSNLDEEIAREQVKRR